MARRSRAQNGNDPAETGVVAKPQKTKQAAPGKPKQTSGSGGRKGGAWADPTPAQIEQSIRDARLPLEIALEIDLHDALGAKKPRLPLVECAVNSWQELIELQRIIDSLQRPVRRGRGGQQEEDALECMVFGSSRPESTQELQLSTGATNSAHSFATALQLRVQSLGLASRTLLADRVLVRLPAQSVASPNSQRLLPWNSIVVTPTKPLLDQPSIQRVALSPVPVAAVVEDPLAKLRNPELVTFVDELLDAHTQTGRAQVVVLRGIPGSGKSSLGREILTICEARGAHSVVCSADLYFETPRGYHFDVKRISKAHESCQQRFHDAIRDAHQNAVVVVDNTHTTRWEYEGYEKAATEKQCGFHVLEMQCVDVPTCIRMAKRNSHGVTIAKVMAMFLRWERDARAAVRVFTPRFHDALVLANPVTRNPVNNYVAYVGLFLDDAAREKILERVAARHSNLIAEHVTLFYKPTTQYIRQAPIGKTFTIRVTHSVEDDRGQALQVELCDELHLKGTNNVNHITVSTAQGVSAFYSNELLEDPKATRHEIHDLELEVTLGIAMMAQNRKIITLTSPFEDQFITTKQHPVEICESEAENSVESSSPSTLTVLEVAEDDLLGLAEGGKEPLALTLLREELIKHGLGPHVSTRRVIAIRKAATSLSKLTSEELTVSLLQKMLPTASMDFDAICFVDFGQSLASALADGGLLGGSLKRVTLLQPAHSGDSTGVFTVPVTIKRVPGFGSRDGTSSALSRLVPDLNATLTKSLDAMGVSTTEEACFVAHLATHSAESALAACGFPGIIVKRVDSSLWTCPSTVVDIAVHGETPVVSTAQLIQALKTNGIKNVLAATEDDATTLYFQLPTIGSQSPVIRWQLVASETNNHVALVETLQKTVRDSLSLEDQEAFPRIACLLAAIVRARLTDHAVPVATVQLLCERAVVSFFQHRASEETASKPEGKETPRVVTDHRLLWSRIVACLDWLSSWPIERWVAETEAVTCSPASALVGELVHAAIVQASRAAAGTVEILDESSPQWSEMIQCLVGSNAATMTAMATSSRLVHRHLVLENDSQSTSSLLTTLAQCDRLMALAASNHTGHDVLFAVPFGVVSGHIQVSATSEELIDRVVSALRRKD